ncbi:MAG TPA: alpha/beta hydrolase [Egibacteraceae bacterium]|nr:alpha/beta hydrolase [Egibacteraceae bacterium]
MTADDRTLHGFPHRWVPGEQPLAPTLLLLHGTGGNEDDLVPLGRHLSPGSALLSPRGKVREHGLPRWFCRLAEGVFDEADVVTRAGELAAFVRGTAGRYRFDPDNVVAVGFSNGANIAAAVLLLHPEVLRGAVLFSAMLPLRPATLPDLTHAAVYLSQGRVDPMAPPEQAEALATLLDEAGAAVTVDWHDGGHTLGAAQADGARRWLLKLTAATAADAGGLP